MSKGKKQDLPAKTQTDLVLPNQKAMRASKQTTDKRWRLMKAQQIVVTIQQPRAKKQQIQKQAADMQILERTQQTSLTTRRPKKGTIQSWTWSQRSHKVNRAWWERTKMHSCTWTNSHLRISPLVPALVNTHKDTMHPRKTKTMVCSAQLCNSTPFQDSPQSKVSNKMLTCSRRNLISC